MPAITMPKLSDTMTEGTVVRWLKKVGDQVQSGDLIAEIETDKATMEMESWEDGVITELAVDEGGKVPVGGKVAFVKGENEAEPAAGAPAKSEPAVVTASSAPAEKSTQQIAPDHESAQPHTSNNTNGVTEARLGASTLKASPLARKMATEAGLDLRKVKGSGPGGRIIKRDIEEALDSGAATAQAPAAEAPKPATAPAPVQPSAPAPAPVAAAPAGGADKTIPLTNMRRIIAERLLQSKTTIPHFYLTISVDAGPLLAFRADLNEKSAAGGNGIKFTINDFVVKAIVAAATRVPEINASFNGDSIIQYADVNICVAIAVEDGLVTPVIRAAQSRTLSDISLQVKDMAARARDKKLRPDEFQGGTITISNLGAYGVDFFDAIINPPQAAIVSVGAVTKEPVVNAQDEIVVGHRMNLGLSCDHRVVDGAVGAKFMAEIKRLLETPYLILV